MQNASKSNTKSEYCIVKILVRTFISIIYLKVQRRPNGLPLNNWYKVFTCKTKSNI